MIKSPIHNLNAGIHHLDWLIYVMGIHWNNILIGDNENTLYKGV